MAGFSGRAIFLVHRGQPSCCVLTGQRRRRRGRERERRERKHLTLGRTCHPQLALVPWNRSPSPAFLVLHFLSAELLENRICLIMSQLSIKRP